METDAQPTEQALLAALRQHAAPRQWLSRHPVAAVIDIAVALKINAPDHSPACRKDELIDRILLAEWNRGAQ